MPDLSGAISDVDGTLPSHQYCDRLLEVYDSMRKKRRETHRDVLLSHVPEWAHPLAEGEVSEQQVRAPTFISCKGILGCRRRLPIAQRTRRTSG